MAIYHNLSPMPKNFQPPRAGSMPPRRQPIPVGLSEFDETRARRLGQGTGVPLRATGKRTGGAQ